MWAVYSWMLLSIIAVYIAMGTLAQQQQLFFTAPLLPLSAQYTAPFTERSNGLHQSK
jgi:hypothetical protein